MIEKKTMLVDCDGVVLNWEYAFDIFMEEYGFKRVDGAEFIYDIGKRYGVEKSQGKKLIKQFNESAAIGFLPPLRDSVQYITKLAYQGWQFIAVTSLSTNKYAQKLRRRNLDKIFGKGTFVDVQCLPTGADKDKALSKWKDSGYWWVEDKPENAMVGFNLGLKPIVMEHGFNMNSTPDECYLVKNWKEIYKLVNTKQWT